jgi:hypothetical protein
MAGTGRADRRTAREVWAAVRGVDVGLGVEAAFDSGQCEQRDGGGRVIYITQRYLT